MHMVVQSHPENKLAISANEYCCGCLSPGCGVCPFRIVKAPPSPVLQTCGRGFKSVNPISFGLRQCGKSLAAGKCLAKSMLPCSNVQNVGHCDCGLRDAWCCTGLHDRTFEFITVASMAPTGRGFKNFWIWSVHVSTFVEVDTMVLRISSNRMLTSPRTYDRTNTLTLCEARLVRNVFLPLWLRVTQT